MSVVLNPISIISHCQRNSFAPLRRIRERTIEVFQFQRNSDHPYLFAIHEQLECAHVSTSLMWDFLDLINPHTSNPAVTARRRRCTPCGQMLAKKPPQSVAAYEAALCNVKRLSVRNAS